MPFFIYFKRMENEFLHKINLEALKKESGLTPEEIAKIAGISDAKNIGKWAQDKEKGGSRPNYNALVRLLENGVTVETLFGVNYVSASERQKVFSSELLGDEEFQRGVQKAIEARVDSVMDARVEYILRQKGVI